MSNQMTTTQDMQPIKRFELPINVQLKFLKSLPLKTCSDFTSKVIPSYTMSRCAIDKNLVTHAGLMEEFATNLFQKNLCSLHLSSDPELMNYLKSCNSAYFESIKNIFEILHILSVNDSELLTAVQGLKIVDIDAVDPRDLIVEYAYNAFSQLTIEEVKQFYSMISNDKKFANIESFNK